jgi:hypothetical protein
MRSQRTLSALAVAALFGATTIASAQTQPAADASSAGKTTMDTTKSNMKPGTTTGSAMTGGAPMMPHTIKGVLPNPSSQDSRDAGTGRGK